jgi:hypothetical protein
MWPRTFGDRLASWNLLRVQCQDLPIQSALTEINRWWYQTPWKPYYLHWDDNLSWPDPWQLLSDNIYCEVARSLGILYTISLLERADMADAELVLTEEGDNLVLVAKEKYILNWNPDSVVNTFQEVKVRKQYQIQKIK